MKIAVCFFALAIAYACAARCKQTSDCDPIVTSCRGGSILHCMDFQCVCDSLAGVELHECTVNTDCHDHIHDGFFHQCAHNGWQCINYDCQCTSGHGN
ncbi:uncharacterized protein LOC127832422 [Dreissena polymorpha]|uniref:Uncharacterized protein n=1 Tax=Dreissena polymorpha TaxID=45954 RepID=A0A9D4GZ65_DREPO|nr:uncharacterized protein LOC127832422 [Dreissena polymorpha]KAH3822497.1 hypothetical protein DPMN_124277 [Dreissena polymorpha]